MHTEKEAKTKWCPFANFQSGQGGGNRWAHGHDDHEPYEGMNPVPCRCIASQCMAWRWRVVPAALTGGTSDALSDTHGFCGMAGRPE